MRTNRSVANTPSEANAWRMAIGRQIQIMSTVIRQEGRLLKHWKGTHSHSRQYFVLHSGGLHYDDDPVSCTRTAITPAPGWCSA